MNLNKKQRVIIITQLAEKLITFNKKNARLFLEEYTGQEVNFYFNYDAMIDFIKELKDPIIAEIYKALFPEEIKIFSETAHKYHLSTDKLVLFFSHSHKDVKLISSVKKILEQTEWIECFVAHKDTEPAKDWEEEIKKYLECCHCVVPFLSNDFKLSKYCDQEIGFAVKRNIPIFPIKLDNTDPYGFIKHIQATTVSEKRANVLANQIEKFIFDQKRSDLHHIAQPKIENITERLKNNFLNSTNVQMAESVLEQLDRFKQGQIPKPIVLEIHQNWKQIKKINEVKNIDEKINSFFKKHPKITEKESTHRAINNSLNNQIVNNLSAKNISKIANENAKVSLVGVDLLEVLEKVEKKEECSGALPF